MYQNILLKYKKLLKEKLVIKDMVPRLECIRLLSENDFLINIDNVVNVQVPSKLIDYTLSGRPILSFKQDEIPNDKFYEFISSNYSQKYLINVDDYNITSVASKFNSLILGG